MKKGFIILSIILLIPMIYAECNSSQIDINSASAEELDSLSGIGPAKANEIISSRPFSSVDELINVNGIGEVTLEKIKTQGLACVENEEESNEENNNEEGDDIENNVNNEEEISKTEESDEMQTYNQNNKTETASTQTKINHNIINLNYISKDIKINDVKDFKAEYAIYETVGFCMLILLFLILKFILKKKNERREN